MGRLGAGRPTTSKTWSNLPPHWSISIRLDLMLMDYYLATTDPVNIFIDSVLQLTYFRNVPTSASPCDYGYPDLIVLGYKNITGHTASTLSLEI